LQKVSEKLAVAVLRSKKFILFYSYEKEHTSGEAAPN
jgi:hypothetical protein